MKIAHITPSFYPATAWGGPIASTKAICDGISAWPDMQLRVLTTDAAGPRLGARVRRVPLPYGVTYARRIAGHSIAPGLLARLPALIGWADVVHLTGVYSFTTLPALALARALGKPLVWSPRGALQATAQWQGVPNRRAKHLWEHLAQLLRPAHTVLHTTAPSETAASTARLRGIATVTIPNCVTIPPQRAPRAARRADVGLRLVYLGRLHPKKGVDLLIDALAHLPCDTRLDIHGTGDAAYVGALMAAGARYGARLRFCGQSDGAAKARAFERADLCVLPSHSENFGIVVAEALAHGVPVLTTTATPWRALDHMGAGACIDLAQGDLAGAITALAQRDLRAMGARGRDWMIRDFSPQAMVADFAQLYRALAADQRQQVRA